MLLFHLPQLLAGSRSKRGNQPWCQGVGDNYGDTDHDHGDNLYNDNDVDEYHKITTIKMMKKMMTMIFRSIMMFTRGS